MEQDMSPAWAKAIEHDNELEQILKLVAAEIAEYCNTDTGGGASFFAVCDYVEKALGDPDLGDHGHSFDADRKSCRASDDCPA